MNERNAAAAASDPVIRDHLTVMQTAHGSNTG